MTLPNIPGKQSKFVIAFQVWWCFIVILSNDLIKNRNESRDMLNLIAYTLKVKSPFSFTSELVFQGSNKPKLLVNELILLGIKRTCKGVKNKKKT